MANSTLCRPAILAAAARRIVRAAAPDRQRSFDRYGAMAETYEESTRGGDYYRRQAVARLAPSPGEVILDVGCGDGRLSFACAREGAEVFAFDPDEDVVAIARTETPRELRKRLSFVRDW